MDVSVCAELLAGRLETRGIASLGLTLLLPGYRWLRSLWEQLLRLRSVGNGTDRSSRELIRFTGSLLP